MNNKIRNIDMYLDLLDKLQETSDEIAYTAAQLFLSDKVNVDLVTEPHYAQAVRRCLMQVYSNNAAEHERQQAALRYKHLIEKLKDDGIDPNLLP